MRTSVTSLSKKFISTFFAVMLALGLVPAAAFAADDSTGEESPQNVISSEGDEASNPLVISSGEAEGLGDEKSALIEQNEGEALTNSSGEDGTVDVLAGGDDANLSIPAATQRVNEDVTLSTRTVAQAESTRSYFLAQTLESTRTVPIVSANLPLDMTASEPQTPEADVASQEEEGEGSDDDPDADDSVGARLELAPYESDSAVSAESTVIGSFTYLGMTFAVEPGGESVAVVVADYSKLPEEFIEAQVIVLPSMVTADGIDYYTVTRIADNAFSTVTPQEDEEGITAITIPASITSVGDDAFTNFDTLQYVIVSEDNPNYGMYDGCLYDADLSSLLLIPEGRLGAVRIASSVTSIDPEVFSHCPSVDTLVADADSAAYQLLIENDLHNANGKKVRIEGSADSPQFEVSDRGIELLSLVTTLADDGDSSDDGSEMSLSDVRTGFAAVPAVQIPSGWSIMKTYTVADWNGSNSIIATYSGLGGSVALSNHSDRSVGIAVTGGGAAATVTTVPSATAALVEPTLANATGAINDASSKYTYHGYSPWLSHFDIRNPDGCWSYSRLQILYNSKIGLYARESCAGYNWSYRFLLQTSDSASVSLPYCSEITVLKRNSLTTHKTAASEFGFTSTDARCMNYAIVFSGTTNITLNLDGGACSGVTSNTPFVAQSPYSLPTPSRTGYSFLGWSVGDSSAVTAVTGKTSTSGIYYNAGSQFYINKDVTFKANWKVNTYTVSFNANGGSGGQSANVTATYGSAMPAISTTKPTRTGYTFGGWYDTSAATGGTQYYTAACASATNWNKASATTLYARWTANTYTVSFNANGGSGGQSANVTATYGSAMPTISTTKPTRTGYTFGGWYDTSAATGGTQYYTAACASATNWNKASATTLYARWTANTYKVSFNNNDGSGGQSAQVTATYDAAMPAISTSKPTRTGYTFGGWYDTWATSGGTQYYTADCVSARTWNKTADTTLYARWNANTYTVSFNANGGSGGQSANVTATYGSAMPAISTTKPTRTGYTFGGWYDTSAATGGTQYYTAACASATNWNKASATTLYARWTANTYTVSFNANGGSGGQSANVTATYGSAMPAISTTKPTRAGYTFGGWYDTSAATGGNMYYTAAGVSARTWWTVSDFTLYARWTANDITLTWNAHGGTAVSDTKQKCDVTITLPSTTKAGYTFAGWWTAETGGTQMTSASKVPTSNTTYHARWTANEYTVSFDGKGGAGGQVGKNVMAIYDDPLPAISTTKPTLAGYDFAGWWDKDYTTKYYTEKGVAAQDAWKVVGATILYAKWTKAASRSIDLTDPTLQTSASTVWYWPGKGYVAGSQDSTTVVTKLSAAPSFDDYEFLGYFDGLGDTAAKTVDADGTILAGEQSDNATWFAHWKRLACSVELKANYGGWDSQMTSPGTPSLASIAFGSAFNGKTTAISKPARTGYTFLGYWTEPNPRVASEDECEGVCWIDADGKLSGKEWTEPDDLEDKEPVTLYAAWSLIPYTVVFDPGTDDEREHLIISTTYDAASPIIAPIPVARGKGDVFLRWGIGTDTLAGWKQNETFTIEDVFEAGYAKESVKASDEIAGKTYPNVVRLPAVWAPCVTAELPLTVAVYVDPESGDTLAGEGKLSTSYDGEVRVLSLAYDKAEPSLLGGGTDHVLGDAPDKATLIVSPIRSDAQGDDEELFANAAPFGLSLEDEVVFAGEALKPFPTFGKDGAYLRIRYGISFADGFDLSTLRLPNNDYAGVNGVSSQTFPIAKLYYTVGLA